MEELRSIQPLSQYVWNLFSAKCLIHNLRKHIKKEQTEPTSTHNPQLQKLELT